MAAKKEAETPKAERQDLATMLGLGESFMVGERKYKVKPLLLKDVPEFLDSTIHFNAPIFSMSSEESRAVLDRWMKKYVRDENDKPVGLDRATKEGWSIADLKKALNRLLDLSGLD